MHQLGTLKANHQPLTIPLEQRFQSVYAIGQTGTGKSTFLKHGFLQDVYSGFGACYFDFHGQDARWLLDRIPRNRLDDVIYVNPLDPTAVIGFNPFDGVREGQDEQATAAIVASLKHIFADSWGGRMDDILTNAVRPLFHLPYERKTTLLAAIRMLNDPTYRVWVLKHCRERAVTDFWEREFANWTKSDQNANVNSTLNKIRRFEAVPLLRRTFGQVRSRINLRHAVEAGKLIIFDFNKPQMGEVNASVMGALFLSRLIHEAMTRPQPTIDGEVFTGALKPFFFHIDEFHSVMSSATTIAFSEGRKFRMGISAVHQFTRQLTATTPGRQVFDAVVGNVGTKIVFRIGGNDADELFRALEVAEPKHLTELPDYNFIAYLKQGRAMKRMRATTVLPDAPRHGYGASIIRRMKADVGTPITEIDTAYETLADRRFVGIVKAGKRTEPKQPATRPRQQRKPGKGQPHQFRPLGAVMLDRFCADPES
ncbi:MAG: hypothetical protein AAGK98_03760 [Pseudomonadota bacterium]